jgi:pimeloyl-ACP methyl ester carboxylesterase
MIRRDYPDIVTLVASPPVGTEGSTADPFIDATIQTLRGKRSSRNLVLRVSSVRDVDLELSRIFSGHFQGPIRLQIVGHNLAGGLALGAVWIPEPEVLTRAFKFPFYTFDTNPSALGLLSKHAGKISEVMLVGCSIGSAATSGYAINGRTLTYTLAELFRCTVMGADDVVAPTEFDERGWYRPLEQRRGPKGWRWIDGEDSPPVWFQASEDGARRLRAKVA